MMDGERALDRMMLMMIRVMSHEAGKVSCLRSMDAAVQQLLLINI